MILPDVNVLVYAHREDVANHAAYRTWFEDVINGDEAYGISELVLSGFVRVVTHPKVFNKPSPLADALAFADQVREPPNSVRVEPGMRHWDLFRRLCVEIGAKGNLVPDAYLAAMAIESGCEWITRTGTSAASGVCAGVTRSSSAPSPFAPVTARSALSRTALTSSGRRHPSRRRTTRREFP